MIYSTRGNLVLAFLAAALFSIITVWTGYPPLVDEFLHLGQSYLPDFGPRNFLSLITQRPVAYLQTWGWLKFHVFERSFVLFWVYYFFHALGVLCIFRWIIDHLGSESLKRALTSKQEIGARWIGLNVICLIIALYPGWFEITLMAEALPFGLSIFFLGMSLGVPRLWIRVALLLFSFQSHESTILPAFVLLSTPTLVRFFREKKRPEFQQTTQALLPAFLAASLFFLIQAALFKWIQAPRGYQLSLEPRVLASTAAMFFKFLWVSQFYKPNWISSALEWATLVGALVLLIRKDSRLWIPLAVALLLPHLGALHSIILSNYYAPRAIHGAMVLKSVAIGLILAELFVRLKPGFLRWVPIVTLAAAYLSHHALIVYNRGTNGRLVAQKMRVIEAELKTCASPCTIHAENLSDDLLWDWMIDPTCHEAVVRWLAAKNGIHKELRIIARRPSS